MYDMPKLFAEGDGHYRGTDTTGKNRCAQPQHIQFCQVLLLCCFSIPPVMLLYMMTIFLKMHVAVLLETGGRTLQIFGDMPNAISRHSSKCVTLVCKRYLIGISFQQLYKVLKQPTRMILYTIIF